MSLRPAPRLVGRYLLCDVIASGGMATVHLARLVGQERFTRIVALKQLYPHFARDRDFVAMFLDEARLLSRIRHPNVVAPLDISIEDSELFIAMEYVHGEALSQLVRSEGTPVPVSPAVAVAIITQVLLGLHAAHEATDEDGGALDIVHRDVSPQNILVGEDGIARIVDFGIAKAVSRSHTTGEGRLKGKLGYMAPEQIRMQGTDRRADIFTTGIVLWELLTGERLFPGDNPGAVVNAILNARVTLPNELTQAAPRLDAIVLRALAPEPSARYQTAKEMAAELARAVPAATSLEIGAWVERLAGPELARRARLIAEVERIDIGELTLTRRAPNATSLLAKGVEVELVPAGDAPREASTPPSTEPLSASLASPAPAPGVSAARRRRFAFGAGAVLLAGAAAVLWWRERPNGSRAATLVLEPISHSAPAAPRVTAETPSAPLPQPVSAPPPSASSMPAATSAAAAPPLPVLSPRGRKPPAETPKADPTSKATQDELTTAPSAGAASPVTPNAPKESAANARGARCAVPYTVDQDGVKRYKPECF